MTKRTTEERRAFYLAALEDQRHLLRQALAGMGKGDLIQALPIATCIRVFVHESGRSVPLLKRIRPDFLTLTIRTMPTPRPEEYSRFSNPMTLMHLPFGVSVSPSEPRLFLKLEPDMSGYETSSLGDWWNKPVLKVPGCSPLSRREVVLGVADKEGAHADDDMSENYRRVLESEPLKFNDGTADLGQVNVTRFTVGSAGIELLAMLDGNFAKPAEASDSAISSPDTES
jgi:hypothetical protein